MFVFFNFFKRTTCCIVNSLIKLLSFNKRYEICILPAEFCDEGNTVQLFTYNNHIQAKEKYLFQNGGQMTHFCFASFRFGEKIETFTFLKAIFDEI